MNKILWKLAERLSDKDSVTAAFLALSMSFWWTVATFTGIGICAVLSLSLTEHLSLILCTAAYICLIFGLLGGCLYWKLRERG